MIKDTYLRLLCIPLLGMMLPIASGIVNYEYYPTGLLLLSNLYFILTSLAVWLGCNWIHATIRPLFSPVLHLTRRILTICFTCGVYGSCIACLSVLGWMRLSGESFKWDTIIRFNLATVMTVVIFTLVYEIMYLAKEKEQDLRTVNLLDRERSQAELHALQNEMDPHFLFNSLNTLNHLILSNSSQAHLFNNKLAQVYKYFLQNKNKELIPLEKELEFLDDYFFLLRLRYDKKLELDIQMQNSLLGEIRIPPCSLQILVENAIKHNAFSENEPLRIVVTINSYFIRVANKMRPKPYIIDSTQIGLNNLSSRYKLLFNKDIIIKPGKENFTVNLPVIRG